MTDELLLGGWLVGAAIRSVVVLLVAWTVASVFRRSSAANLYRIWFLGLLSCLVLVPISNILPQWKLSVLSTTAAVDTSPALAKHSFDSIETYPHIEPTTEPIIDQNPTDHASMPTSDKPTPPSVVVNRESFPTTTANTPPAPPSKRLSTRTALLIVWFIGMFLVLVRYAWQWSTTRPLRLAARTCDDPNWLQLNQQCMEALRATRSVTIAFHTSNISPMVIGILWPTILLPESAKLWNTQRRRLVLLHEISHIRRNDLLTELIATLVGALYWFNPLTWFASRQLKKLREIACDDAVVMHTSQPELYAETLLSIALTQRHRPLAGAITMARTNNVTDRILNVLDSTRSRRPLTYRSAISFSMLALGLTLLIGTGTLTSRAQEIKPRKPTTQDAALQQPLAQPADESQEQRTAQQAQSNPLDETDAIETKSMTVRVLDEDGQPISGAKVHVRVIPLMILGPATNRDLQTDENGEVSFLHPVQFDILMLWTLVPGYVPMYVKIEQWDSDIKDWMPPVYEFRLPKGQKLSGRIVDENGAPVVGAKIEIDLDADEDFGPSFKPSVMPLAIDEHALFTDEHGKWEATNAPSVQLHPGVFRLTITHSDYAADKTWGELQKEQGITTERLRDGTAVITLHNGSKITGTITDPQGNPITTGNVNWSKPPHTYQEIKQVLIDASGHYETPLLTPGTYQFAVFTPGFAPLQQQIEVRERTQQENLQLKKGNTIKIRVLDSSGKPVARANVSVESWHNSPCIFTYLPRSPDGELYWKERSQWFVQPSQEHRFGIGIPRDKEGVFVWNSAPEDAVHYNIGAPAQISKIVPLAASPDVHEVSLSSQPIIFGTVSDKSTGKPIENFSVHQVLIGAGYEGFSRPDEIHNAAGKYQHVFEVPVFRRYRYRVRIEALGYRTAVGTKEVLNAGDFVQENFALEPAVALTTQVLGPDGKPVKDFEVTAIDYRGTERFHFADDDYLHMLSSANAPVLIHISAKEGYAEALYEPGSQLLSIQLRSWSSLTGRLMQGNQAIANQSVTFSPVTRSGLARFDESVKTDSQGNFRFTKLPPLPGRVYAPLDTFEASQLTSSESVRINLEPGKNTEVELSGDGAKLSGRVVTMGRSNDNSTDKWSACYLIRRGIAAEKSDDTNKALVSNPLNLETINQTSFVQWVNRREFDPSSFQLWLDQNPHHFVKLASDGAFTLHGVKSGQYDLLVQLFDRPQKGIVELVGQKLVPIVISDRQAASGIASIGDVDVTYHAGPRVGADMRTYPFVDSSSALLNSEMLKGRYILLHLWTSWSPQSVKALPEMVVAADRYSQFPLTFISLNLDKDPGKAKALVESLKMSWPQNYIGPGNDLRQQLAASGLPAYYFIDPNGKLVGSSEFWGPVEGFLQHQFKPEEVHLLLP